jgi:hypothetical protein
LEQHEGVFASFQCANTPAEEIANWMLSEAHFCMGAKAGSGAGLQIYDMFARPGLQTMICLQADQQGLQSLQTYDMFAST